MISLIASSTT